MDSLRSPLTPDVRCASEEGLVSYLGPCLSSQASCISALEREPRSQRTAHAQTIRAPRPRHSSAPSAPHHFAPGRLVLAHLARTRSFVFGRGLRSRVQRIAVSIGAHAHQPGPFTAVLSMPTFTAHRFRGTVPSSHSPANTTRASVAWLRARPKSGASAASTRPSNPACSGLAQLRCARH